MKVEFESLLDLGTISINVLVKASGIVYRENYGADADGNRGEMREFIDDFEIKIFDFKGNDLTYDAYKKREKGYGALRDEAYEKLYEKLMEFFDGGTL